MSVNEDNVATGTNPTARPGHKFEINSSLPTSLAAIKPLDGANYIEWADRLEDVLKCQGLWIILTNEDFEKEPVKKQWLQDKALGTIKLAINRKAFAIASSIKDPTKLWGYQKTKIPKKIQCNALL